jgi:hypothetical protein
MQWWPACFLSIKGSVRCRGFGFESSVSIRWIARIPLIGWNDLLLRSTSSMYLKILRLQLWERVVQTFISHYLQSINYSVTTLHEFCQSQYKSRHCVGNIAESFQDLGYSKLVRNFFESSPALNSVSRFDESPGFLWLAEMICYCVQLPLCI